MTLKSDAKFEEKVTWAAFDQSIQCFSLGRTEKLCLMALKTGTKFEGKLTCASKNNMRNLANFHRSTWKSQNWGCISWKCISLKFTGDLYAMTMKNDAKIEEELTCQSKIDMRILTNFDLSTRKSQRFSL